MNHSALPLVCVKVLEVSLTTKLHKAVATWSPIQMEPPPKVNLPKKQSVLAQQQAQQYHSQWPWGVDTQTLHLALVRDQVSSAWGVVYNC